MQVLIFRLNDLLFGMITENVKEITKKHTFTTLPKSAEWVQGLINIRGEVLTLINTYSLLKIDVSDIDDCYNRTVIVKLKDNNVALMVDEIIGVTELTDEQIEEASAQSLITVDNKVVNMLELNRLFEAIEE